MITSTLFFFLLAIHSIYYSEEGCDLYQDLEIFDEHLQQDVIVKTFLEKYPHSIPSVEGVDESDPPKADIKYKYENDKSKIELRVYVREVGTDPNDCFWPVSYDYSYQDEYKTKSVSHYSWEQQDMLDFLNGLVTASPYKQLRQGVDPENVKCKEEFVRISKYDGSPACVKPPTAEKLIERGWAKPDERL